MARLSSSVSSGSANSSLLWARSNLFKTSEGIEPQGTLKENLSASGKFCTGRRVPSPDVDGPEEEAGAEPDEGLELVFDSCAGQGTEMLARPRSEALIVLSKINLAQRDN